MSLLVIIIFDYFHLINVTTIQCDSQDDNIVFSSKAIEAIITYSENPAVKSGILL